MNYNTLARRDNLKQELQKFSKRSKKHSHEDGEGWAVSYSDLLMVLMSFFIVFYSVNDSEEIKKESFNNVLIKLKSLGEIQQLNKENSALSDSKVYLNLKLDINDLPSKTKSRELASLKRNSMADSLSKSFKGVKDSEVAKDEQFANKKVEVEIDLPHNIYKRGAYSVDSEVKKHLDKITHILKDDLKGLQIIIVGHTDKTKFKETQQVINNNLILSSLRAAKAVEYLISIGLPEEKVFVQGLNGQPRDSRSLSVRLREI